MKLLIVCRYNQARSITIGAFLRKIYPEHEIFTCGIEGVDAAAIPQVTVDACQEWVLNGFDRTSRSMSILDFEKNFDAVLAADSLVYEVLKRNIIQAPIYNLLDFSNSDFLLPTDPTGFSVPDFRFELAKALLASQSWMNEILGEEKPKVNSTLYLSQQGFKGSISRSLSSFDGTKDLLFLDTQLRYPDVSRWRSLGIDPIFFNPRALDFQELPNTISRPSVLISRFEVDQPMAIYLTKQWQSQIMSLQSRIPSLAITSCLYEYPPICRAEALISLIFAGANVQA